MPYNWFIYFSDEYQELKKNMSHHGLIYIYILYMMYILFSITI